MLAVGRTGHGKSAFVKSLAIKGAQSEIKIGSSSKPVTEQVQMYAIDPVLGLPADLYVVDTPGLREDYSVLRAIGDLQRFIEKEKCEVVAVAYAFNMQAGREFDESGRNWIVSFYQNLRIPLKIKEKNFFIVYTFYDELYRKKNQ